MEKVIGSGAPASANPAMPEQGGSGMVWMRGWWRPGPAIEAAGCPSGFLAMGT